MDRRPGRGEGDALDRVDQRPGDMPGGDPPGLGEPDHRPATATVDRRDMTYLYHDGEDFVFMDDSTYEQIPLSAAIVGDAANYLTDNQRAVVAFHGDQVLSVELPATVTLRITHTEPGLQGDRSSAGTKPATIETGFEIQVPLYMDEDTLIKVDTRTGAFAGRVNE